MRTKPRIHRPDYKVEQAVKRNGATRKEDPRWAKEKLGTLYVKCAVADGRWLFLSSADLTEDAFSNHKELGVLVTGGKLPVQVRAPELLDGTEDALDAGRLGLLIAQLVEDLLDLELGDLVELGAQGGVGLDGVENGERVTPPDRCSSAASLPSWERGG
jgi:hypothetical protein